MGSRLPGATGGGSRVITSKLVAENLPGSRLRFFANIPGPGVNGNPAYIPKSNGFSNELGLCFRGLITVLICVIGLYSVICCGFLV